MGEHVVGRELTQTLARRDRLVVPAELAVGHRKAVPAIHELGIEVDRLAILGDRLLELVLPEEIDGLVVELILRGHAGCVPHSRARWKRV